MQKVADGFIKLVIEHDETYGEEKKKKRAARLGGGSESQTPSSGW
jgi:hypothetical protein